VPKDLHQLTLFEDRPAVFARAGHPLAGQLPTLAQLASYSWAVPPQNVPLRESWERWFEQAGQALPPVPIECGSVIMIREILLDTDFLTILSGDQLRVELEAGWVEAIAGVPEWFCRTIGVTSRTGWRLTPDHKRFMDHLVRIAKQL
jgi:DNA-binding transcriptional LysR family regulator